MQGGDHGKACAPRRQRPDPIRVVHVRVNQLRPALTQPLGDAPRFGQIPATAAAHFDHVDAVLSRPDDEWVGCVVLEQRDDPDLPAAAQGRPRERPHDRLGAPDRRWSDDVRDARAQP